MKNRLVLGRSTLNNMAILHLSRTPVGEASLDIEKVGSMAIWDDAGVVSFAFKHSTGWTKNHVGELPELLKRDLSNLENVAVNTNIVPATSESVSLGSSLIRFLSIYGKSLNISGTADVSELNAFTAFTSMARATLNGQVYVNGAVDLRSVMNADTENSSIRIKDPTLANEPVSLRFMQAALSMNQAGQSRREFCQMATSDDRLVEGVSLADIMPFSDDDLPSQLDVSFVANGNYILAVKASGNELFKVYDDAGVLKVTKVDVEQPKATYMYRVNYDLLNSPDALEVIAEYTISSDNVAIRTGMQYVGETHAIKISVPITPKAFTEVSIAGESMLDGVLSNLQGQLVEIFARMTTANGRIDSAITKNDEQDQTLLDHTSELQSLDARLDAVEETSSNEVWKLSGNTLSQEGIVGSANDMNVTFVRNGLGYIALMADGVNRIVDFLGSTVKGIARLTTNFLRVTSSDLTRMLDVDLGITDKIYMILKAPFSLIEIEGDNFTIQPKGSSETSMNVTMKNIRIQSEYSEIVQNDFMLETQLNSVKYMNDSGNGQVDAIVHNFTKKMSAVPSSNVDMFAGIPLNGYGEITIMLKADANADFVACYRKTFHKTAAGVQFVQDDMTSERGIACDFIVTNGTTLAQVSADCSMTCFYKLYDV